ncbi:MAG: hypothetical protein WC840_04780 [Candidatus Peribacteraceae bacterium]
MHPSLSLQRNRPAAPPLVITKEELEGAVNPSAWHLSAITQMERPGGKAGGRARCLIP